jgi:hypothetical protein
MKLVLFGTSLELVAIGFCITGIGFENIDWTLRVEAFRIEGLGVEDDEFTRSFNP